MTAGVNDLSSLKTLESYHDNYARLDRLCGGVRRIPIATRRGTFKVWTKRVGNNPRIRLLLLL